MSKAISRQKQYNSAKYEPALMCKISLPETYDPQLWAHITQFYSPERFRRENQIACEELLKCHKLFKQYFKLFYCNHAALAQWRQLSKSKYWEIGQYQCRQVLEKPLAQWQQLVRDSLCDERKVTNTTNHCTLSFSAHQNSSIRNNDRSPASTERRNRPQQTHTQKTQQGSEIHSPVLSRRDSESGKRTERKRQAALESEEAAQGLAHELFTYFKRNAGASQKKKSYHKNTKLQPHSGRERNLLMPKMKTQGKSYNRSVNEIEENELNINGDSSAEGKRSQDFPFRVCEDSEKSRSAKKKEQGRQEKFMDKEQMRNLSLSQDFHELYLQTFHACDGLRYIFYNFEKHMKGLSEREKYNTFIRQHHRKTSQKHIGFLRGPIRQVEIKKNCLCESEHRSPLRSQEILNIIKSPKHLKKENSSEQKRKAEGQKNGAFASFLQAVPASIHPRRVRDEIEPTPEASRGPLTKETHKGHHPGGQHLAALFTRKNQRKFGPLASIDSCEDIRRLKSPHCFLCAKAIDAITAMSPSQRPKQTLITQLPKQVDNWELRHTSYEFSPVGQATGGEAKKKSKVVFRRLKSTNFGRFIRK